MTHVTFTIGQGSDARGKQIEHLAEKRALALEDIAKQFGGYTAHDSEGGWIDPKGHLVTEPSVAVDVMTDKPESEIRAEAEYLAEVFNQSAVMLTESPASVSFIEQATVATKAA